jgi:hypothetical protein
VSGHPDQGQFDLQRRRPDQPGDLGLGAHLVRHQVQQADLQGPDILARRRLLRHHHHALAPQHVMGGQGCGDLDRPWAGSDAGILIGMICLGFQGFPERFT